MGRWVEFTDHFMWHVPEHKGRVTIAYKPGKRFVKDDCAEKAIAKGRAKPCKSPRQETAASETRQEDAAKPKAPVYASGAGSSEAGSS